MIMCKPSPRPPLPRIIGSLLGIEIYSNSTLTRFAEAMPRSHASTYVRRCTLRIFPVLRMRTMQHTLRLPPRTYVHVCPLLHETHVFPSYVCAPYSIRCAC
ncbi:unnamed protein product, partial [Sphacelaria rigidula]